ncbi:hypothetical protein pb186bvf_020325 [Paramecium bursaria]
MEKLYRLQPFDYSRYNLLQYQIHLIIFSISIAQQKQSTIEQIIPFHSLIIQVIVPLIQLNHKYMSKSETQVEGTFHMHARWKTNVKSLESPNKSRRKVVQRRLSVEDNQEPSKSLKIQGNAQRSDHQLKINHKPDRVDPFKIKDYIKSLNPSQKRELSRQHKNDFLQFLLLQKAGQPGDQRFFDKLIHIYNFDPSRIKKTETKENIIYLSKRDEREELFERQLKIFINNLKTKKVVSGQPLDEMIKEKHENLIQRLPKFRAKLETISQQS